MLFRSDNETREVKTDANLTNLRTGTDQKRYSDVNTLDWEIAQIVEKGKLQNKYLQEGEKKDASKIGRQD